MSPDIPSDWMWIVVVAFIVSFLLAFGIGANDVANTFGTSVGSKVISLLKACILASIFEILGAILIGYRVSDTIRKGMIDPLQYNGSEKLLALGNLSALTGSCIWMFIATILRLPVSATHSIVGATIGFSLVARGTRGVGWEKLGFIVGSWFVSPVMSGIISTVLFVIVRKFVLNKDKPLEPGLKLLPLFYAFTIFINALSVFLDGSELLHFDKIPQYGGFIISVSLSLISALLVKHLVVPYMRRKVTNAEDKKYLDSTNDDKKLKEDLTDRKQFTMFGCFKRRNTSLPDVKDVDVEMPKANNGNTAVNEGDVNWTNLQDKELAGHEDHVALLLLNTKNKVSSSETSETAFVEKSSVQIKETGFIKKEEDAVWSFERKQQARKLIKDKPETKILFSFLQILTAIFGSFAHGGNDVSNAIGPLIGVWMISTEGSVAQKAPTPLWILVYGGAGISFGLWILGRRVIKTIGEDLAKVTPSSGFCIEIGAATTVLLASYFGLPISTTHCKVGSIIFVGRVRSNENVDWSLFRNIFIAWVVTLPASASLSALMMYLVELYAL